jgi:DNA-binding transcriptional LysR family regulator
VNKAHSVGREAAASTEAEPAQEAAATGLGIGIMSVFCTKADFASGWAAKGRVAIDPLRTSSESAGKHNSG